MTSANHQFERQIDPAVEHPDDEEDPGSIPGHGHGHGHGHGIFRSSKAARIAARGALLAVRQILSVAREDWLILTGGTLALLASTAINVSMPYSLTFVLREASQEDATWEKIARLAGLVMASFVAGALLTGVRVFCFMVGGERVVRRLRQRLFTMVAEQPMTFFDQQQPGELVSRLSADCDLIRQTLTVTMVLALRFGMQVFGGVALLFVISWQMTLVLAAILPVLGVVAVVYSKKARSLGMRLQAAIAGSSSMATEVFSSIRHVKAFDQERFEVTRYTSTLNETYQIARQLGIANSFFLGGAEFGSYLAVVSVLLYATYLLLSGALPIEFIISYVLYAVYVAHAVGALSHQTADLSRAVGASERVFQLLNSVARKGRGDREREWQAEWRVLERVRGEIRFDEVSFAYHTNQQVDQEARSSRISQVSFTVAPGEILGVIGPSGAGKSTLLSLLLRFYEPHKGKILLDGHALSDLDAAWVRRNIGYVSQEPVLFNTSILDNIRYGKENAVQEEVIQAARSARIHDFITSLPLGYDTIVGDRGSRLSGGQKQRIGLARVFLKDAPIVLFDEPTSALDTENQKLVLEAIGSLFQGRTCIIVSHSAELLRNVERVLVMGMGGVVEAIGTPAELAKSSETLAKFFAS